MVFVMCSLYNRYFLLILKIFLGIIIIFLGWDKGFYDYVFVCRIVFMFFEI